MEITNVRRERRGATRENLVPTYILEVALTASDHEAVTNNTERAAKWREVQDAIAAWVASS